MTFNEDGKNNKMHKVTPVVRWIMFLPAVTWMIFIFYMSAQTGGESGSLSERITRPVIDLLDHIFNYGEHYAVAFDRMEFVIRKCAHMTEYAILFLLIFFPLKRCAGVSWKAYMVGMIIAVIYAGSDEVHQYFVAGRHGCISDVLIDSAGAVTAAVLTALASNKKTILAAVCIVLCGVTGVLIYV